ncbi:hypothetical protein IE00_17385 [Paracoccus sp. SM22M-07]|nr:hypothetical protein IE00_17385 [Paracoccus sp. SM22M-07]
MAEAHIIDVAWLARHIQYKRIVALVSKNVCLKSLRQRGTEAISIDGIVPISARRGPAMDTCIDYVIAGPARDVPYAITTMQGIVANRSCEDIGPMSAAMVVPS